MAKQYRQEYLKKLGRDGNIYGGEVLSILLGNAFGGEDMSAVSAELLERFPSVRAIIEADMREIMTVDGVTEQMALYFKTLDRVLKQMKTEKPFIKSTQQCMDLAFERLCGKDNEYLEIYLVNKSGKVVEIKRCTSGSSDEVRIAAAEVLSVIVSSDAYGLYCAHNHVNAAAAPSEDDDKSTTIFLQTCAMCRIVFFDHCIVSSNGERFSYRASGRLDMLK